jgi:hypothetical protein
MPSDGRAETGSGRVSGECSERNLDPAEHARTLSRWSEPIRVEVVVTRAGCCREIASWTR